MSLGEYAYARWTVRQLERILSSADYIDAFPLTFSGREEALEFEDVINNLRDLMDIAFKSVMGIEGYAEDDPQYKVAKELFINDDGIPYGAVMYGMFLNLYISNVFNIHPSIKHSTGADLENVHIHGLRHKVFQFTFYIFIIFNIFYIFENLHVVVSVAVCLASLEHVLCSQTMEYQRLDAAGTAMYGNQFSGPLDANALLGDQIEGGYYDIDWPTVSYVGSALSDAFIVLDLVTADWEEVGLIYMGNNLTDWALGQYSYPESLDPMDTPYIGCNSDRMGHVAKGVLGIRMDGVEDVVFRKLKINDLHESSKRGSDLCSDYWDEDFTSFTGKGHFLQNTPYLYGYTGNRAIGMIPQDTRHYTIFLSEMSVFRNCLDS